MVIVNTYMFVCTYSDCLSGNGKLSVGMCLSKIISIHKNCSDGTKIIIIIIICIIVTIRQ